MHKVRTFTFEVFSTFISDGSQGEISMYIPNMINGMNFARIGVNPGRLVSLNGVVFPATFEKLVDHLHELIRSVITFIVLDCRFKTKGFCSAF